MNRILAASLLSCCLWSSSQAADASKSIAASLQKLVDDQTIAGAVVLVADKEKVLDVGAVGLASLDRKEPMRTDDLFWIASMTKTMTGTAMMMLVDEGKVKIDDPVEKYLPEFKGQLVAGKDGGEAHAPLRPITIKDVLSHTSGLVLANDKALKRTGVLKDDVAQIAKLPLRQEPGTKYEYNNSGINTAGRIIEVVSGDSYTDFMQKRLFGPLGMKDTTFWPNEEQAARLAHSARRAQDKVSLEEVKLDTNATPELLERLSRGVKVPLAMIREMGVGKASEYGNHYGEPAGGLFSTAADLGQFCRMLLNEGTLDGKRLLSPEAVRTMTANQTQSVPVNPQEAYGIGWSVKLKTEEGPSVGSFGHRGARRTAMWVDPKNQLAMIILVERFDMTGEEQKRMYEPFFRGAIERYGKY